LIKTRRKSEAILQVRRWLDEEKLQYAVKDYTPTSFKATLQLTATFRVTIEVSKETTDSVRFQASAYLTPADQRAYSRLNDGKKDSFLKAVRHSLFSLNVDHSLVPDGNSLQHISIVKIVYFDGLTKDKLFDTILLIKCALGLLNLAYYEHLRYKSSRVIPG
jgi:hypothetical protein